MKTSLIKEYFIHGMLAVICIMQGCSYPHLYYSPDMMSVPLMKEKGEVSVITAGSFGTVNPSFEMQAAFALPGHIALGGNFMTGGNNHSDSDYEDFSRYNYFEGFGGFYTSFGNIGIFEIYAGYGESSQRHTFAYNDWDWGGGGWVQDGTAKMQFSKLFIQPDVGIRHKAIQAGFALRLSRVNFTEVTYANTIYRLEELQHLSSNRTSWLLEPGFTFRVGQDPVNFHIQVVLSPEISGNMLEFEHFRFNFGMNFRFGKKKNPDVE